MSILYADTSAVLKRVVPEVGSAAVRDLVRQQHEGAGLVVASSLAWLEVWRALRRLKGPGVQDEARLAMAGIDEFPLDAAVLDAARRIGDDGLRSLDAIHLASAVMVGAHEIMTFDARLADAARAEGIPVTSF